MAGVSSTPDDVARLLTPIRNLAVTSVITQDEYETTARNIYEGQESGSRPVIACSRCGATSPVTAKACFNCHEPLPEHPYLPRVKARLLRAGFTITEGVAIGKFPFAFMAAHPEYYPYLTVPGKKVQVILGAVELPSLAIQDLKAVTAAFARHARTIRQTLWRQAFYLPVIVVPKLDTALADRIGRKGFYWAVGGGVDLMPFVVRPAVVDLWAGTLHSYAQKGNMADMSARSLTRIFFTP